jgi:hypothetical protein
VAAVPARAGYPEQMVTGGVDDRGAAVSADLEVVEVGVVVTRTAAMVSAWILQVAMLVASTFWPGRSWLMGTATPLASRTLVPAVKDSPAEGWGGYFFGRGAVLGGAACSFFGNTQTRLKPRLREAFAPTLNSGNSMRGPDGKDHSGV